MDIVAYLRMLRRHWKIIVAAAMIGAVVGAVSTLLTETDTAAQRTYYKATHTLFLDTSNIGDRVRPVYTNLDQIAVLATTGDVPRRVAAELGGDSSEWTSRIFTVTNGTTNTLDITCAMPTDEDAVTCADTFATELIASLEEREQTRFTAERDETIRRLDTLKADIATFDAQIAAGAAGSTRDLIEAQRDSLVNQYRLTYELFQQLASQGGPSSIVSTLESAEAEPISQAEYNNRIAQGQLGQNRIRADIAAEGAAFEDSGSASERFSGPVPRGILGALLGLMMGVGLAVVADRVDRRLRTREEVEAAFGMAVLAEVPTLTGAQQRDAAIVSVSAPLSRTAEAYRAVRSSLMFQRATDSRRHDSDDAVVVLVGSAGPKEGKTTTSANLATVFAETGSRVSTINCDFRRPTLHQFFDIPNEPRRVVETEIPGLWVVTDVTTGPTGANPALVVEEQRRLVASARKRFDVIILDTAPLLTTNDATEIMASADLAVIVCRAGVTTSDGAQRTRELLARIAAPVSGVVLLGSEASPNDYYYYYSRSAKQIAKSEPVGSENAESGEGLFGPDPTGGSVSSAPPSGPRPTA